MKFKVGDKFECIKWDTSYSARDITVGKIYTIKGKSSIQEFYIYDDKGDIHHFSDEEFFHEHFKEASMRKRIEALTAWDKEADDIMLEMESSLGNFWLRIACMVNSGFSYIQVFVINPDKVIKEFKFQTQCEKLEAFKDALLWLAEKAGKLDDKKDKIKTEIAELKVRLSRLEDELND